MLLVLQSEEEDGGENGSDLDELGVSLLATWSPILPVGVVLESDLACWRGREWPVDVCVWPIGGGL